MDTATFKASCEKYLNTTNLYEAFGLNKDASEKEVKNAYRRLSLQTHPDRVEESEKEVATEKFKIVSQIYSILSDAKKRKVYDLTGDIEEDVDADWLQYWKSIFKVVSEKDIQNYEKKYKGSEEEITDIREAYLSTKGDMNKIMDMVPFADMENEERIADCIREMIASEEVPDYAAFSQEKPERKKKRKQKMVRQRKAFEKAQAERSEEEEDDDNSLQLAIAERNSARRNSGFLAALERKYVEDKKRSSNGSPARASKRNK